jgi:hypothetical protein
MESLINTLLSVMGKVTFDQKNKQQVCDPELLNEVSKYKNDHINFKAKNFEQLNKFENFKVVDCHSCNMGRWIDNQEQDKIGFTHSKQWEELKDVHEKVHSKIQTYVTKNASKASNEELRELAKNIEEDTVKVFHALNNILEVNCSSKV